MGVFTLIQLFVNSPDRLTIVVMSNMYPFTKLILSLYFNLVEIQENVFYSIDRLCIPPLDFYGIAKYIQQGDS